MHHCLGGNWGVYQPVLVMPVWRMYWEEPGSDTGFLGCI